jgi:hypothetical protein
MRAGSVRWLVAAALVTAAVWTARAAVPTFWQVSTEAEFLKGEVENLSIDAYGRLTLGPAVATVYEPTAPFLWTIVGASDGSAYVGSGNEGQVYRVDASGRGRVFFDSDELEVHALAIGAGGVVYAGTSPNGRIYRIDATGAAMPFFDPPDPYIWSLAVDRAGAVYAATGDKGVIYKIAPSGQGAVFYQTKATHALSLTVDGEGRLVAGTGAPGRVFRFDSAGKPFVLLDSSYAEIRALRADTSGTIYGVAVAGRPTGGASSGEPARPAPEPAAPASANVSTEIVSVSVIDVSVPSAPTPAPAARPSGGAGAGAVFRILPDGASDILWESREDTPYDVAVEPGGTLLVATGGKGKVFRLSGDLSQATLVARANAQQATTLLAGSNGQMLVTTSNPGRVMRLSSTRATRGTYTSEVRDAVTAATWGTIAWKAVTAAAGTLEIATRSGNTRTPDEAWSEWSAPYTNPAGSQITSPRARYLQWRAVLGAARDEAPLLTSVTAAYLPRNTRPRVTSVTVHPPGTVFQRPFPTGEPDLAGFDGETPDRRAAALAAGASGGQGLGRRAYEKGLLTFVWRAEDENRDDLTYEVQYRSEGQATWKSLRKGLKDAILVWDTSSVPDGRYLVRVLASDDLSNSPATALVGSLESTVFEVDNAPPTITVTGARREASRVFLTFDVRDPQSAVQKVDYSLDGDRWQTVYPKDGIADSPFEQFELALDGEAASRGVILRATDALNNVANARGEPPPQAATPASGRR